MSDYAEKKAADILRRHRKAINLRQLRQAIDDAPLREQRHASVKTACVENEQ